MRNRQDKTLEELYYMIIQESKESCPIVDQEIKSENFKKFSLYDFSKYETSVSAVLKG